MRIKNMITYIPGLVILLTFFYLISTGSGFVSSAEPSPHSTYLKKLTTDGPHIVEQATGQKVILRGITFTGGVWSHPFSSPDKVKYYTSEWDFNNIKSWGANVITLYMDYHWFLTEAGYRHIEEILNWCRKYNIYIIPQITVYPIGGHRGGPGFFNSASAKKQLRDFWKEFAQRYKHREEIAGYCIMDEPHTGPDSFKGQGFKRSLKNYMELIIDDIRKIDTITPIFIECVYGSAPDGFIEIAKNKKHIVYNIHFYEPMGYTAAGYPWICNGGVPINVRYPGEYIRRIRHQSGNNSRTSHHPVIASGSKGWTRYEVEVIVPQNGCDMAFISMFCDGDYNATLYFDNIQYSINNDKFKTISNGSFEQAIDYNQSQALIWMIYDNNGKNGKVTKTDEEACHGTYSMKFSKCRNWTHCENIDYWISSAGAINVKGGQKLKIRFWVKTANAGYKKNGIQIKWAEAEGDYLDKQKLQELINQYIIERRVKLQKPFFVGEFSPSLVSPRPDCLNYLKDTLEYFNKNDLHWTYYVYREGWGWLDPTRLFMGIYNGPEGITTDNCPFKDTAVMEIVKSFL